MAPEEMASAAVADNFWLSAGVRNEQGSPIVWAGEIEKRYSCLGAGPGCAWWWGHLLLLFAIARLGGLAGQSRKGADLNGAVGKDSSHLQITTHRLDEVAQGAHQHVGPVLDLGDLGLFDIEGFGQGVLREGEGPAQFRQGHLLPQLLLALLDALTPLRAEVFGEFRERACHGLGTNVL